MKFIITGTFVTHPTTNLVQPSINSSRSVLVNSQYATLKDIPVETQEYYIVEDLLYVLVGFEGTFIKATPKRGGLTFTIDQYLDRALCDLVKDILPCAAAFAVVKQQAAAELTYEDGFVRNALSSAIAEILDNVPLPFLQFSYLSTSF